MFRKANAHDIEEITALYMDIHTEEEAGRMSTGWIRSIYPTRETVESMVASEELFVKIADDRIVAVGRINQEQVDGYANVDWEYKAPDEEVMMVKFFVKKDPEGNEINSWYYETWKKVKMPAVYPKDLVR